MPSTDKNSGATEGAETRLRSTIRSRLRELGISAREASRRAGFNVGYVGDILDGRSKAPEADRILRLAETLDFDAADFLGDSPQPIRESRSASPWGREPMPAGRALPVLSAGIPIQRKFVEFRETGTLQAPFALTDVEGAYAVIVPNNTSAPRFFVGETVLVNPIRTPRVGDFVFARCTSGAAGIARLVSIETDSLELEYIGLPESDSLVKVSFDELESVHPIVATTL